jgi:hypothetical protein
MNQQELERLWAKGELANVAHAFGDVVRVDARTSGRVVALLSVTPEAEYVVELPDGTSRVAKQSEISRAD